MNFAKTVSLSSRVILKERHAKPLVAQRKSTNNIIPFLFIAPSLLFFISFSYFPFIRTIITSFTMTDAAGQFKSWVGFNNFTHIFKRPDFSTIIINTLKFASAVAVSSLLIGFALALFANMKIKGFSRVNELLFSMPLAIASASAAIVWGIILQPQIGALNYILGANINWLQNPVWAFFSVTLVTVWLQMAVNFIFLLTGLRVIPQELMESAKIDGAAGINKFFRITLSLVSPTLFFVIFFNAMASFQAFGQIRLLTAGGPGIATRVLVYDIYLEAFMNYRFGTACAQSLILFAIMFLFTLIQFKFEDKGVHYS